MANLEDIAARAYQKIMSDGGITIDLRGAEPKVGYAYSPYPELERVLPMSMVTPETVLQYLNDASEALAQPGNHFGGWHDTESGNVFLDVTQVGPAHPDTIKAAAKANQLAVFDLSTFQEIPTGITREVTADWHLPTYDAWERMPDKEETCPNCHHGVMQDVWANGKVALKCPLCQYVLGSDGPDTYDHPQYEGPPMPWGHYFKPNQGSVKTSDDWKPEGWDEPEYQRPIAPQPSWKQWHQEVGRGYTQEDADYMEPPEWQAHYNFATPGDRMLMQHTVEGEDEHGNYKSVPHPTKPPEEVIYKRADPNYLGAHHVMGKDGRDYWTFKDSLTPLTDPDEWKLGAWQWDEEPPEFEFPRKFHTDEADHARSLERYGLPIPHEPPEWQWKMARVDPEWMRAWIEKNGPYMEHSTHPGVLPKIREHGLLPHDTEGIGSIYHGFLTPRANHVYLGYPMRYRPNPAAVHVDLRKLDWSRINADEDPLADAFKAGRIEGDGFDAPVEVHKNGDYSHAEDVFGNTYRHLGDWADALQLNEPHHVAHSLNHTSHSTLAVEGGINPECFVSPEEVREWFKAKGLAHPVESYYQNDVGVLRYSMPVAVPFPHVEPVRQLDPARDFESLSYTRGATRLNVTKSANLTEHDLLLMMADAEQRAREALEKGDMGEHLRWGQEYHQLAEHINRTQGFDPRPPDDLPNTNVYPPDRDWTASWSLPEGHGILGPQTPEEYSLVMHHPRRPFTCPSCDWVGMSSMNGCPHCGYDPDDGSVPRMSAITDDFMPGYFHVAPTVERGRIQTHGLQPSDPYHNEKYQDEIERVREQYPHIDLRAQLQPGLYLTPHLELARDHGLHIDGGHDIWYVPHKSVPNLKPDMDWSHIGQEAYYSNHPVLNPVLYEPWESRDWVWNNNKKLKRPVDMTMSEWRQSNWDTPFTPGYYHAAPTSERQRIMTHGLHPADPKTNPEYEMGFDMMRQKAPEALQRYKPGVYVAEHPEDAMTFGRHWGEQTGTPHDIWYVPGHQVQSLNSDPDESGIAVGRGRTHGIPHHIPSPVLHTKAEDWWHTDQGRPVWDSHGLEDETVRMQRQRFRDNPIHPHHDPHNNPSDAANWF